MSLVDSGSYTPETIARKQKLAELLLGESMKPQKITHWAEGLAQLGRAGVGGYIGNQAEQEAKAGETAQTQALARLLAGDTSAAAAPAAAPSATPTGDYAQRIAGIESGGKYDALGPETKGDRAYGKYQVMGANVPSWTKAHLGQEMTPDQFLANPQAQDAVFKGQFGQYANKYGPEGAARAWFAGEGGMNNPNARDVLGTSVADYAKKFTGANPVAAALNQPTQVAQAQPAMPTQGATDPRAKIAAMLNDSNPYVQRMGRQLAQGIIEKDMVPHQYGFQTLPDGTILRTDPRTGKVEPTYQAATKPTWGVIGETASGDKQYGWIDPVKRTAEPVNIPGQTGAPATVPGPDGKPIPIPPGVDAKDFRKRVTEATADAATGKKTEVQAKDEKFANKMELAEKNLKGLEGEGTSRVSRALDSTVMGVGVPFGNSMQGEKYQMYRQARDNFITALLRDESGAAIGTAEFDRYEKEYFPQPGDGPKVIAQKADARRVAIDAMKKGAGPAYKPPTETTAPIKVQSPEEAAKLPKGTAIILPDGSPGVVP